MQSTEESRVQIRPVEDRDIAALASVHARSFESSGFTALGQRALEDYYAWQIAHSRGLGAVVAEQNNNVIGFCMVGGDFGTLAEFLRSHPTTFAMAALRRPQLLFDARAFRIVPYFWRRLAKRYRPAAQRKRSEMLLQSSYGVQAIAVVPEARKLGVGKKLMDWADEEAIRRGFRYIYLSVDTSNERAIHFYEGLGWVRVTKGDYWNGHMKKDLSGDARAASTSSGDDSRPGAPPPSFSVIVPARNEHKAIVPFLESVLAQEVGDLPFEVLVADGASNDGTREILDRYAHSHPVVRVLDNPERFTSSGLNRAISAARGNIILRMDCHTRYRPDYIAECLRVLEETGADNVGGAARVQPQNLRERMFAAAYRHPFSCGGARFHDEEYEGPCDTVPYGCWRRETLARLGLFDEALIRNQDDELNLRTIRAGGRIWQSRRIVSWYSPRQSLTSLFRQYLQYGYWKVAVIRKHHLPASWRHLIPGLFVAALMLLPIAALASFLLKFPSATTVLIASWIATVGTYALASLGASALAVRREGWAVAALLPVMFAVYHLAYGTGFLAGLFAFLRPARATHPVSGRFADLTR